MRFSAVLALLLAAAMAAAVACDSGRGTPASTPTAAPVGSLLIYIIETPVAERMGSPMTYVVAYDAEARRELHRTQLDLTMIRGAFVFNPKRREVYVSRFVGNQTEISALDPISGAMRTIFTSTAGGGIEWTTAVSPDGRRLAVTVSNDDRRTASVKTVDVETGDVTSIGDYAGLPDGFSGPPVPRYWRDDGGGILVSEDTQSGRPGGWATIKLDGSMGLEVSSNTPEALGVWPSPNGRLLVLRDGRIDFEACDFAATTHRVRLVDLDADRAIGRPAGDRVVAVATAPGRGLAFLEWSPDGNTALFGSYALKTASAPGCGSEIDPHSAEYFTLSTTINVPQPVSDIRARRSSWHPGQLVEFTCAADGIEADIYGGCPPYDQREMYLDGLVDIGEGIRVLGFLEPR